ncbi:MAG: DUF2225 domain-containing protein [Victivallales bacterium]|nr:DUF2225 domain-containing protein [Victivallales bacterium]
MEKGFDMPVFIPQYVDCPACGLKAEHLFLDEKLYSISGYENDLKPVYEWKKRIYAKYNPHLYFVLQCPTCFVSADIHFFKHPSHEFSFGTKLFEKKARELVFVDDRSSQVLTLLKDVTSMRDFSFTDAIRRYLSAIFFLEQFNSIVERDSLALGRCWLHYSWLLKDMYNSAYKKEGMELFEKLRDKLKDYNLNIVSEPEAATRQALLYYETCHYFSSIPDKHGCALDLLQLIGRLELELNRHKQAQNAFFKCIQKSYAFIEDLKKLEITDEIRGRIQDLNTFAEQTRSLLKAAKKPE